MKRLRRLQRVGGGLFVAGVAFLMTSLLIGTGWNVVTSVGLMLSGALTWGNTRLVLRHGVGRSPAAADDSER